MQCSYHEMPKETLFESLRFQLCPSLSSLYPDTMIQVASSFSTEPSIDVVLSSIPARIYEAVSFLKENMETFTAKVRRLILCRLPQTSPPRPQTFLSDLRMSAI